MSHKDTWKANEQLILDADKTLEDIEREYFRQLNIGKGRKESHLVFDINSEIELYGYDHERQHLVLAAALIMRLLIKEPQ